MQPKNTDTSEFPNFSQQNLIRNQIETLWVEKGARSFDIFEIPKFPQRILNWNQIEFFQKKAFREFTRLQPVNLTLSINFYQGNLTQIQIETFVNGKWRNLLTYLKFQYFRIEYLIKIEMNFSKRMFFGISLDCNQYVSWSKKQARKSDTFDNLSSTKLDSKLNWNFGEWKRERDLLTYLKFQSFLNEFWIEIKVNFPKEGFLGIHSITTSKLVAWKSRQKNLTLSITFHQRNLTQNQLKLL